MIAELQITVDCDVLQADGGTRTAAICGGYVALHDAFSRMVATGTIPAHPVTDACAAISVGVVDALPHLDLDYSEDVRAEVDMNVVMTGAGKFVEVQGTAEGNPFSRSELDRAARAGGEGDHRDLRAPASNAGRAAGGAPVVTTFVLATANPDKAREIVALLGVEAPSLELVARPPEVPDVDEVGETLEDNARIKAVALCAATGLPAVADDTGLHVDALGGAPGVHTARYAGEDATYADNVEKLLGELDALPLEQRAARFATVAVARWPDGLEVAAMGEVEGVITSTARGDGGFGYDPVFVPLEGDGRTFAEMTDEEKHALSHRARAFRTLAKGVRVIQETEGR